MHLTRACRFKRVFGTGRGRYSERNVGTDTPRHRVITSETGDGSAVSSDLESAAWSSLWSVDFFPRPRNADQFGGEFIWLKIFGKLLGIWKGRGG